MRNAVLVLVCSLTLAACVAHEKAGDSAAAVGDWKAAYTHYRQALAEKPETPGLKEKHDQARTEALADSWQRAKGCEATADWRCAFDEAEFVRSLDPVHQEAIALRARASTQLALGEVNQARTAANSGQYQQAFAILKKARTTSQDPAVQEQAVIVQQEVVNGASAEAERLRQNRKYNEAIALYELLAEVDGSYREAIRVVSDEREQHLIALYEEEARHGDAAMRANDFRAANAAYAKAEQIRPNGRALPMLRYTAALIAADEAITARNWQSAETALRDAVTSGQDDGRAAAMLERVKIRTYKVSLRSVLLQPTRLDGNAWVGKPTPLFFRISQQIAKAVEKKQFDKAIQNTLDLPYENRPKLKVVVDFPDGMKLETPTREGAYTLFEGEFTLAGNGFDDRVIAFRVYQEQGNEEIGRVEIPLREVFTDRDVSLKSQTIAQLRLQAEPAEGRQPNMFVGMTRLDTPASGRGTGTAVAGGNPGRSTPPGGNATPASGGTTGKTTPASGKAPATVQPAGGKPADPGAPADKAPGKKKAKQKKAPASTN